MVFPVKKFKNMSTHRFNIEIVTPLFSGGADGVSAELRAPTIKGMMRFWWRALYGSDDIKQMKKNEAAIFGDTDHKSDVVLSLDIPENCKPSEENIARGELIPVEGKTYRISIIEYLAYGLFDQRERKYIRRYYSPENSFSLQLNCSKKKQEIWNSLRMIHQFGGFGSRCRNGFGSIEIKEYNNQNSEEEFNAIKKGSRKKFTSFSKNSILFLFRKQTSWNKAMFDIGVAYRNAKLSLENRHQDTRRQLIASPIDAQAGNPINDRHAKPYFLHVHKMESGRFRGQILFLPYQYYKNEKIGEYDKACSDMNISIKKALNFDKEISASRGV
ncbi:MAG: type III-B CRISPR module RAMP protein Cmr1 [Deltaproteobacteria bacterium]|nr:type III-B CRISPR module RAMP protein Cmr1 [Deltaproteobacteria bacterium]